MSSADPPKPKRPRRRGERPFEPTREIQQAPANDAGVSAFGGCYQPADFQRWGKMPFWTPIEAACLSRGLDPVALVQADDQARLLQPNTLKEVQFRIELFERAVTMHFFAHQILPAHAIALLDGCDEVVPPELRAIVAKIRPYGPLIGIPADVNGLDAVIQSIGKAPVEDEDFPSTRSGMAVMIGNLQKLLLAAAHDAYGLQPHRSHNPTVKHFLKALDGVQLELSEDAIQKHIKRAIEAHWLGRVRKD